MKFVALIKYRNMSRLLTLLFVTLIGLTNLFGQSDSSQVTKKYQAKPKSVYPFGKEAFLKDEKTTIRWLGNAGFLINSRGTRVMIDPMLKEFDMPVLFDAPVATSDIPELDAVLITHSDNDHFSIPTCKDLSKVTKAFHSTIYVDSLMNNEGWNSFGHAISDEFIVGNINIKVTPADHQWQNAYPGFAKRFFRKEDCAGFFMTTVDGTIWATGDSKLMPEHFDLPNPDVILFDISDSEWHFTVKGALQLSERYPDALLICSHWGTVDAPDFTPFNGDPEIIKAQIKNPNRLMVLSPGEPFILTKSKK